MKKLYTLKELESLPTISQGQFDDLKIQTPTIRIWLSRMTKDDGQPYDNEVTIEEYHTFFDKKHNQFSSKWETIKKYKAINPKKHYFSKRNFIRKEKVYVNGKYKYAYIYKNKDGKETSIIKGKEFGKEIINK